LYCTILVDTAALPPFSKFRLGQWKKIISFRRRWGLWKTLDREKSCIILKENGKTLGHLVFGKAQWRGHNFGTICLTAPTLITLSLSAFSQYNNSVFTKDHYCIHTMDLLVSMFPALQSLPSLSLNQSLLLLFTGYLITKVLLLKNKKGLLPPGPCGLPVLGNIFQIPQFPWLKYTEWQKEFGNPLLLSVSFTAEEFQVPSSHSTWLGTPSSFSIPMKLQPICWVSFPISHRESYHLELYM
jgi:hypothetical protein